MMQFKITYVDGRSSKIVDETYWDHKSIVDHTVLKLKVGQETRRFYTAGYKSIKRLS